MTAKKYCLTVFFCLVISLLTFGVCNLFVDPLHLLPFAGVRGLNAAKPMQRNHERLYKIAAVTWEQPQVVILGSSRSNRALNPMHPAFHGAKAFNLSVTGSNMAETRDLFEHALASTPLKMAVIELDLRFFDVRNDSLADLREYMATLDDPNRVGILKLIAKTSLSRDTLQLSLQTLIHQNQPSEYRSDGQQTTRVFEERLARFGGIRKTMEADLRRLASTEMERAARWKVKSGEKSHFEGLDDLQQIIREANAHNVALYLYMSPSHALDQESIRDIYGWDMLEQWKQDVAQLVESEREKRGRNGPELRLWDFSGYNSVTTQVLPQRGDTGPMTYYWDQSHYQEIVGNWVLERMFAENSTGAHVPDDFGVELSTANLAANLEQIRERAAEYRLQSAELTELVANLCDGNSKPSPSETNRFYNAKFEL